LLSDHDSKLLEKILKLGQKLEQNFSDGFNESELNLFLALLNECQFSASTDVTRLHAAIDHLHPKMTLQHFLNFLVPIERILDRSLKDSDFSISAKDNERAFSEIQKFPIYLVLDNIRSAFNVGSILRLADGLGVSCIYLCGYTANTESQQVQKASMQSFSFVETKIFANVSDALSALKAQNVKVLALETASNSKSLMHFPMTGPTAFLLGNERFGIDYKTLEIVDQILHIPMSGYKNSINVTHAAALACWEWRRQNT
jgi:23S rRNA (guanosine2251-2'-O)-methyltransferase